MGISDGDEGLTAGSEKRAAIAALTDGSVCPTERTGRTLTEEMAEVQSSDAAALSHDGGGWRGLVRAILELAW
jgi:hypothetical protein